MGSISVSAILSHKNCVSVYFNHARRIKMSILSHKKANLRRKIIAYLKLLTAEEKQRQSARVAQKLYELPQFKNSQRVSLYLSTDDEIDTIPILKRLLDEGKKCFIPRYAGNNMEMVRIHSMEDYNSLPVTKWNIKQPPVDDKERENALETGGLDLVLTPGVAFTQKGDRCGHGKGYYDAFFRSLKSKDVTWPFSIGLAFNEQIVNDIPLDTHDHRLNLVLFDKHE